MGDRSRKALGTLLDRGRAVVGGLLGPHGLGHGAGAQRVKERVRLGGCSGGVSSCNPQPVPNPFLMTVISTEPG